MAPPPPPPPTRRRRGRPARPTYRDLADYLKKSRTTQTELARRIGTTQNHISRIATGRTVPRAWLAQRIAEYTGVPLDSFTRVYLARRAMEAA